MGKVNNKSNNNGEKNKNNKNTKIEKKTRCNYDKANVKLAVAECLGGISVAEASRKYHIPESTIRAKKVNKYHDKRPGPATVLSDQEEKELVGWIFHCCKQGFPITKQKLVDSVKLICDNDATRKTPFTNNKPGRTWLEGFFKRHPEISERVSENLSLTRAKVSEFGIREWFKGVGDYLIKASTDQDNLLEISSTRVFNADEIGVSLNPRPPSVLAPKGTKNVYSVVNNNEKENVTVLVTANAAGDVAPTLALFAGQSVPKDAIKVAPPNFSFGYSDNGWMTAKNFYEYVANVFFPWLVKSNIKLPVILYIDGHCSHVTAPLSKFCHENGIILIALYPNATHILQPLDVALFRTFRAAYQRSFQKLCESASIISIKKCQVAQVVKNAFESLDMKKIMENGFKTCGLYPFDANAIDYSKVFKKLDSSSAEIPNSVDESSTAPKDSEALKLLESLIDDVKLISFRANASCSWEGRKEDQSLFDIWFKLAKPTNVAQEENMVDSSEYLQSPVQMLDFPTSEERMSTPFDSIPDISTDEIVSREWNDSVDGNGYEHYMVDAHGGLVLFSEETLNFVTTPSSQNPLPDSVVTSPIMPEITMDIPNSDLTEPSLFPTTVTITNLTDQEDFTKRSLEVLSSSVINRNETSSPNLIQDSTSLLVVSDINVPKPSTQLYDKLEEIMDSTLSSETDTFHTSDHEKPSVIERIQTSTSLTSKLGGGVSESRTEEVLEKLPLENIENTIPIVNKFSDSLQTLCHWPKLDVSRKRKKRSKNSVQLPSVLSSTQWQQIQKSKENEQASQKMEAELKKKMKAAERELKKKAADIERERKNKVKLEKEKEKVEKEHLRILKQQKRMQDLEAKQKLQEESLKTKMRTAEIKIKLAELQREKAELEGNNE